MGDSTVFTQPLSASHRSSAGIILKIRLENFMCHSSLQIELGEWLNFVTGQNGSGKSAILTALCVAFGSRAKETQRATTLKEFIKTGCSYAVIQVEIKNEGEDAFKPEIYGDVIIVERRISVSTSSTVLKDHQGKRVASRKEDLHELVEHFNGKMEELRECLTKKKTQIACMMEKTTEVRRMKEDLQQRLSLATKERLELEEEHCRKTNKIQKMVNLVRRLDQQVHEVHEQDLKNTQAEESEIKEMLKGLQDELDTTNLILSRLKEEESALSASLSIKMDEIRKISDEIDDYERKHRENYSYICELQQHQTNKVTAFGGDRVIQLLRAIERHHQRFKRPPIGPIGAHLTLVNGDIWAIAVEIAIGKMLNAFIVTDHKDSLLLRGCAREANYNHLQIIIYDFSRPRLNIPYHMLPQTQHPTLISALHSDNPTVMNVLVDMGNAERQVLVRDYEVGKTVAFDQRIPNLKEVYTSDGYRMFSRGSVQTILPPNKKARTGRLCSSFDSQIKDLERYALDIQEHGQEVKRKKRNAEEELQDLQDKLQSIKRRRLNAERDVMSKKLRLQDVKNSYVAESNPAPASSVDELHHEISKVQAEIREKEILLEDFQLRMSKADAKANDLKLSFENLCESAKVEIDAYEAAENELVVIEQELCSAETEKTHYEGIMNNKVLPDIKEAETQYQELEHNRKESCRKASIICPESEIEALGGCKSTPEQLSAQLNRLNQRLQSESQRYAEPIEDLRMIYDKKERRILRKQQTYEAFREKLNACKEALDLRWSKFQRNATLLKRQLTWQFNAHLRKKGISGHIKVSYEEKTLSVEVKMPQDASNNIVRDTRGLSGGERSFSTLCFALALHEMTESPFRAMDEFDVFMDAVSRKISLDTLVNFALAQGSQWIFITPHDISMVKQGERIKKQQMAAPRS
ncbi:structural maintenance of chromosomes protein 6B isoform X2 [Vitis vinifera]|uniref:structural maintenance of chromosomes protein 6B isoform X2 n=1 Tax=Vitis vinifera TaxID=29760 RepID=UPI0008FED225|nr:structural maintenance of chromosomes protein 6B isoform X2 [Vitis vinifera]|eukprot:XP_019081702.1 PREDICTED: structural maintenance of chromosomes protein 6B isoform X2 [Vitis vinifera]